MCSAATFGFRVNPSWAIRPAAASSVVLIAPTWPVGPTCAKVNVLPTAAGYFALKSEIFLFVESTSSVACCCLPKICPVVVAIFSHVSTVAPLVRTGIVGAISASLS
ncbi:Uncharacterised protein [Mycobacteroides abscessus subsp. abscessus]|nr:Uncharacterised protein [Mycobacteroides abscessus subsp. abscessus]